VNRVWGIVRKRYERITYDRENDFGCICKDNS
jgi:hypothetical protein